MTEEEKKAIETLQYLCSDDCINKDIIKIIVNLIEKLKKEIEEKTTIIFAGAEKVKSLEKKVEELKNKVIKRDNDIIYLEETAEKEFLTKQEVKENYIPKDKIREKIKELEEYIVKIEEETCGRCITIGEDMCIRYLKELLEEEQEQ